jgi:F-type H+-transporting ATPase subunit a
VTISISAEHVFSVAGFPLTNAAFTAVLLTVFLTLGALLLRFLMKRVPSRVQALLELTYGGLYDMTVRTVGNVDVANQLFPYIIASFLYIIFSNWSGLLPGFGSVTIGPEDIPLLRAPTTDLNAVIVLSLISVLFVQCIAIQHKGLKRYLGTFFNFKGPVLFFVGIIEFISETLRPISYTFRLFGNIFAGEVLIVVITTLTSTYLPYVPILPVPFYALEIFVGFIQAFVFCFLTIVFTSVAIADHGGPKS